MAKEAFDESLSLNYQYSNKIQNSFVDIVSIIEPLHVMPSISGYYSFFLAGIGFLD